MDYHNYPSTPRRLGRKQPARRGRRWLLALIILVIIAGAVLIFGHKADAPQYQHAQHTAAKPDQSTPSNNLPKPTDTKPSYSLTNPTSQWVVVNKQRPLQPKNYTPQIVVPDVPLKGSSRAMNMHVAAAMAPHLEKLFGAAKQAGYPMMLSSGYRSYGYQVTVHNQQVKQYGETKADQLSARPGYSEHQTGWAADVAPTSGKCDLSTCFGDTPTGQWLAANAWRYGFVIRYPKGGQAITGYDYEPWHIRYIGDYAAKQMHDQGITTLEKYFGTGAAPTY